MSSQILLSGGDKYYSYSGEIFGDVSAPATIPMIAIDNTGLRDSVVTIQPFYGQPSTSSTNNALGMIVKLDNIIIIKEQPGNAGNYRGNETWSIMAPRNSKLEVISMNTTANNTQIRGVNVLGYYL